MNAKKKLGFLSALLLLLCMLATTSMAGTVSSYAQLVEAIRSHGPNESTFTVEADKNYDLMKNKNAVSDAIMEAGISTCSYSIDGKGRSVTLSKVQWYPNPQPCQSITDVENVLREMAAQRTDTFTLICDPDTCRELMADHARLLEKIAGQYGASLSFFQHNERCISLSGVQYQEIYQHCATLDDVKTFFVEQTAQLSDPFTMICDQSLYDRLLANNGNLIYEILKQCGVRNIYFTYSDASGMITLQDLHYYPGFRIVRLYNMSRTSELNAREKQALDEALKIVDRCREPGQDPLMLEKKIHDVVCDRVTYETLNVEGETDNDTAIGGLLNGRADCDGYADTFYLVASMAGFEVSYQNGNANPSYEDSQKPEDIGHMWNRIRLGNEWYQVDTTWDDCDRPDGKIRYCWLNSALDIARETHMWSQETDLYPLAQYTPEQFDYYTSPVMGGPAVYQTVNELVNDMIQIGPGEEKTMSVMVNAAGVSHEELSEAFDDAVEREKLYGRYGISDSVNCIGNRSYIYVTFSR